MKQVFVPIAILGVALTAHASAATDALIAKARSAIGEEASLAAVKSLRTEMTVTDAEGKSLGVIISEYKSPMKQREIDYTVPNVEVVSAIDGREGHRVLRRMDNGARQLQILPAEEVNARRDYTVSNLSLLAAPHPERGEVVIAKDETVDGVACAVLEYKYKSGIKISRYLDKATGRLVATRIGQADKAGDLMVNQGEQRVSGILYPKAIVIRDAAGKTLRTLTLAKIEVNAPIDDAVFVTPLY